MRGLKSEDIQRTDAQADSRASSWGEAAVGTGGGSASDSDESEQRVLRQFVEALLFERLVEFQIHPRSFADGHGESIAAIFDRRLEFRVGQERYRCFVVLSAFDRVRIAPGSIQRVIDGALSPAKWTEIVTALGLDPEGEQRLLTELSQTTELCRWNREHLEHHLRPRRELGFQELESALIEGHPYHPSFKARTGFSLQDHRDYGFEAGNTFQLSWLAVTRRDVKSALPLPEPEFWTRELGGETFQALLDELQRQGGDLRDRALLPVHPWQLRTLRNPVFREAVATRDILVLGPAGDRYRASQSLRTLVNVSRPEQANVKLPLDIVCTSSRRTLRRHFVCTAPSLSQWLNTLAIEDPYLQGERRALLLQEFAALLYVPETKPGTSRAREEQLEAMQGQLGVIFRESVLARLAPGEEAVPFTALIQLEADGRPFIADWLKCHGTAAWVERLIEVTLLPIWHILVHHGVAFESHAQNLILVHREGWPEKIVLRDFHDETEFVPDYLRDPERLPDFGRIDPYFDTVPDDDGYRMGSTDALRELFMDTVYVFNLADLSFMLERHQGFAERVFWSLVREKLRAYEEAGITDRARIERLDCGAPEITVESLLKKKIRGGGLLDFFEHRVRNPLHPGSAELPEETRMHREEKRADGLQSSVLRTVGEPALHLHSRN